MILHETDGFKKDFKRLPKIIQKKFQKQMRFLDKDFFYPSLRTKKIKGFKNIWEARVDYHNRFSFKKANDHLYLLSIGPHNKGLGKK